MKRKVKTLIEPAFLAGFMLALMLVSTPIIMANTFSHKANNQEQKL